MKHTQQALDRLLAKCALCGSDRPSPEATIVNESSDTELVHVTCKTCKGSIVALIFTTDHIISSVGVITDLTTKDLRKFQNSSVLNEQDILSVHETLQQSDICARLLQNY